MGPLLDLVVPDGEGSIRAAGREHVVNRVKGEHIGRLDVIAWRLAFERIHLFLDHRRGVEVFSPRPKRVKKKKKGWWIGAWVFGWAARTFTLAIGLAGEGTGEEFERALTHLLGHSHLVHIKNV